MTALSESLLAAQRQAIGALSKAYCAEAITEEELIDYLESFGCTDAVDKVYLLNSLRVLKNFGAPAPTAPRIDQPQMISPGQKSFIRDLLKKGNHDAIPDADLDALPFGKASSMIDALKNGSYDPAEYTVPF